MPETAAMPLKVGQSPAGGSPGDLAGILRKDYDRYGALIRTLHIRAD